MRWGRIIVSAFVCIALASSVGAQPTAPEDGVSLMREGHFDRALVKLKQAHSAAPQDATIENLLGITETQLGQIDEACNHYRNAIRLDPRQAAPHRNLGFNLLNSKDYSHAEPELREASRLNPSDNFAHDYLMLLALATGHDADALTEASRAGQLPHNDPQVGAELIEADVRVGRVDDATSRIESLEQANELSSANEYSIAVLLAQHGFYSEAVHCFRQIALLQPSWENRYNLALALLYNGDPSEASTLLMSLHTERPAHADTLMFLGSAFESLQKMPEALDAYRAALVADPSNPDRTLDYTRLLMDMDRYDEAIQIVQTGMGQASATAPLQLRLGAVEMVKGNYTRAREAFHAALASDPQLDAAYVGLAQTYARQANDADAIHILEDARNRLPGHYLLEYYFGLLASRLGREQEAIVALERATKLDQMSPDPWYELGKLHELQQDWPLAFQALEHVLALNPQFAPAHYQLSRACAHLGLDQRSKQEAEQTHILVDEQRDQALRRQRERAASFQPQPPVTTSSLPR
jgi:tetratricopeptide (TPR) repeat protein